MNGLTDFILTARFVFELEVVLDLLGECCLSFFVATAPVVG